MNITQSGLISSSRLDFTSNVLYTRAAGLASPTSMPSFVPTRDEIKSNHETDKQNEDNTTWFLEYKALLNSKLTTLITSLTNAYTTDLDAAMGTPHSSLSLPWKKQNMQGETGSIYWIDNDNNGTGDVKKTMLDPGAMRSTFAYIRTFNSEITQTGGYVKDVAMPPPPTTGLGTGDDNNGSWYKDYEPDPTTKIAANLNNNTEVQPGTYYIRTPNLSRTLDGDTTQSEYLDGFSGTTTFVTGTSFELDRLEVNLNNVLGNTSLQPTYIVSKIDKPGLENDPQYQGKNIGNNFLLTLYKFFERPENIDLLRFDMFKDVYVVGTSSLPTGSQMQGSIKLDWDKSNGYISIRQERFAAFYHS